MQKPELIWGKEYVIQSHNLRGTSWLLSALQIADKQSACDLQMFNNMSLRIHLF